MNQPDAITLCQTLFDETPGRHFHLDLLGVRYLSEIIKEQSHIPQLGFCIFVCGIRRFCG